MTSGDWKDYGKLACEYDENESKGRHEPLGLGDLVRSPFEKDRDRIIHSAAFRRLQGKTQVFGMGGSDFFRTRLTHSLEVAQIGKGITLSCGHANTDLVEAACLAHDIGHPPFGHTGEKVLKTLMKDHGGFEANAQNLRLLDELEVRTAIRKESGLNLTQATMDAILKYKTPYSRVDRTNPQEDWKFYYDDDQDLVSWASQGALRAGEQSFECQIMDWADDIAYSTHDLDDGLKVGMINEARITSRIENAVKLRVERKGRVWNSKIWDAIMIDIHNVEAASGSERERKGKRRDLIARLISSFVRASSVAERVGQYPSRYQFELRVDEDVKLRCQMLKSLVWELAITDEHVATIQRKASTITNRLFEEFARFDDSDGTREMYPADFREVLDTAVNIDQKFRVACDFISGMTDNYASRMYSRLTEGETGSLMEII